MTKTLMLAIVAVTLMASPSFAKTKVARHCVDKNKKEITLSTKSTKAACKAAGGTWVKVKTAK